MVLFRFPRTDQVAGELRPALVLRRCPGRHEDWLICMVSSQLRHEIPGIDDVVHEADVDFRASGLKMTSVTRTTRVAVDSAELLLGALGNVDATRLARIHRNLSHWIAGGESRPGAKPAEV